MDGELKRFLYRLKRFMLGKEGWVVLVEGKRDKMALERFDIGPVYTMKGRKFHDIAEELSEKYEGVVILTDLDRTGEDIYRKLSKILESYGLKVDGSFREDLKRSGVKFVEKIPQRVLEEGWN
ncbi:5S rRNA maturation endonuclease (ribonuclease M5) [Thermovibrio guaymasensis]|uniref:5S rRNA maturation endonuclease (Ribonuclease M5) n=1 Tax=Thermovibrio guaymasensis TaxID=240167 RepID=A0A420W875_9BACT|nr:toprim domain-containing protein [Thermovibrio guaymasensis]RKQ63504.1 5S rRNA maturation endonuclease (ribonuclease M5) [Thermovibrio guaymasensis]